MVTLAHEKHRAISVEAKSDMREIKLREGHVKPKNFKYYVTKEGKVYRYSVRGNKYKEMYYHVSHGYRRVRIKDTSTNTRRYYRVGRLVAEAFIPNDDITKELVNHKDGDKQNDNVSNLEWCDTSYNTQHAYDNGLVSDPGGWVSTPYHKR